MMNEPIQGSCYASELQNVSKDEQTQWRIEKSSGNGKFAENRKY